MYSRVGADIRAIVNRDVAGESGCIGHDHLIADHTIMRDVRLRHEKTVVADLCNSAAAFCAAMNGNEFANAIATANYCLGFFARKFQILWRQTDRDKRVNVRIIADRGASVDHTVRLNVNAITQLNVVANSHVRTD